MLKLIPFNAAWISHQKIDVKAIYKRPRFKEDAYGELERERDANGLPTWDLTGALPVKQHNAWQRKGYEYVTLADPDSLRVAAAYQTLLEEDPEKPGELRITGDWKQYHQHQTGGPWNWKKYQQGQVVATTSMAEQLRADVAEFGADAVEKILRRQEPNFVLPAELRKKPEPAAEAKPLVEEKVAAKKPAGATA